MDIAIETRGLSRSFDGFEAVKGIDLVVERGSFYGFLGPNGAGKSTTIKMLTGLLAPSSGHIRVLGCDPLEPQQALEMKRRIGVVPEELALLDHLTAREFLTFIGRTHSMARATLGSRVDELLELFSLPSTGKKLAIEFSYGMRKKLALAAALLPNPDLLFLDEPFEGIDAVASRTIREILSGLVERGSTIFLTSHVLEIVERVCDHVGIIVDGELVEQTAIAELGSGGSLEERFLEVVGADNVEHKQLSWLEDTGS